MPSPDPAPRPQTVTPVAVRVDAEILRQAVDRLLGSGSAVPMDAVERFIRQAPSLGISMDLAGAVLGPGEGASRVVRQICLPVLGAGRTVMLFLSGGDEGGDCVVGHRAERAAAVAKALELALERRPGGVHLAQGLIEPRETWAAEAYEAAGLRRLAELLYLFRPMRLGESQRGMRTDGGITPPPGEAWPRGVVVRPMGAAEADTASLHRALTSSYEQTLDCPELAGMRSMEDIVSAHRAVGEYDPGLWWIVELDGEAAGCVLLTRCAAQGCVELVYIGLSPAARGMGLGRLLMRAAVGACAGLEREMRCAVDARNEPARRLYEGLGFRESGRRVAYVGLVKDLLPRKR